MFAEIAAIKPPPINSFGTSSRQQRRMIAVLIKETPQ
jgi:hypothetical protein